MSSGHGIVSARDNRIGRFFGGSPKAWSGAIWIVLGLFMLFAVARGIGTRLARSLYPTNHEPFENPFNSGKCTACGYDLRATPDRCPECGHISENIKS
jgi:hypothetical protein